MWQGTAMHNCTQMRNYEQIAKGRKMKGCTINDSTQLEKTMPYMTMPIKKEYMTTLVELE